MPQKKYSNDERYIWAVVVAQLVKRSLPTPEVRGLNPVNGKFLYRAFVYRLPIVLKRRKQIKRGQEWPI